MLLVDDLEFPAVEPAKIDILHHVIHEHEKTQPRQRPGHRRRPDGVPYPRELGRCRWKLAPTKNHDEGQQDTEADRLEPRRQHHPAQHREELKLLPNREKREELPEEVNHTMISAR